MNSPQAVVDIDVPVGAQYPLRRQQQVKTFRDLEEEVISRGLCCECGGCISFCSAGRLNALQMGEDSLPHYVDEDRCLDCGICYLVCPVTHDLDQEVQDRFGCKLSPQAWRAVTSARATDEAILEVATDGGVVTALLLYMLERGLIQGAIVSRSASAFIREPLTATTREEVISAAGVQFSSPPHLEELGDHYSTYSSGIPAIKGLGRIHYPFHVALVGTPCQIKTVRKMQCLGIIPSDLVTHTIGLFCTENFACDALGRQRLEEKLAIRFEDITKLNIKEDVIIVLSNGTERHVPFEEIDEVARPACLACTDFANEYADLSVGGLGSPHGYTTTLIRTEKGSRVYSGALEQGCIEERQFRDSAERRREKMRMLAEVMAFAQWKGERGESRLRGISM